MGIWIFCDKKAEYSCSYGRWNDFRIATINATFNYIKSHPISIECERGKFYVNKLFEIINENDTDNDLDIDIFLNYCNKPYFIDGLIFLNIYGIYTLCNKSDCEGYYSVGNSHDISQLFNLINDFYIDKEYDKHMIKRVKKIFKHSISKRKIVTIS